MRYATLVVAVLAVAAGAIIAGPLNPPAGPVAPTYKTLAEVEPRTPINAATTPGDADSLYRITQPGSYYLPGNVGVASDVAGIEVAASDVTIDLCGFTVAREVSGGGARPLIRCETSAATNTVVRDGAVRDAAGHGVELSAHARVERVHVFGCGGDGIRVGAGGVVENCVVSDAGMAGIVVGGDSHVQGCRVTETGTNGIEAAMQCRIRSCIVEYVGMHGIQVLFGTVVESCTARNAGQFGITQALNAGGTQFLNNTVLLNSFGGIRVYYSAQVIGNHISGFGSGSPGIVVVQDGNRIEGNHTDGGSDSVRIEAGGENNLVIGNHSYFAASGNGFANVNLAANMVGPVQTSAGTITATSPYANFSR